MTRAHWLTCGFRPFFFLGALAMAASVLAWIPLQLGAVAIPSAFSPRDWHVHAMLFGGVMAIVAGFALTAVANWTGRPPVAGRDLLALVALWLAGRVAVSVSALTGPALAAAVDLLFPAALVAVFAREVIGGGNLRNLRIVAVVGLLGIADATFHYEAAAAGGADYAVRGVIAVILLLVMLVGGRIIPAFTRNWLVARGVAELPAPFSAPDALALVVSAAALAAWIVVPYGPSTAPLMALAGLVNLWRLARWCGWRTPAEPLLLMLHVGFSTVPVGFLAVAASLAAPALVDSLGAVHIWTVGTVGAMTLAVMTRASCGHSGRPLTAGPLEIAVYALVLAGASARAAAPYAGELETRLLACGGLAFAAAYLVFVAGYGRMLLVPPASRR